MTGSIKRRDFLRTAVAGSIGVGVVWKFGGTLAFSQIPVDQKLDMPLVSDVEELDITPMFNLGDDIKNVSPRLALDEKGTVWAAWISEREDGEQLYLISFDGKNWGEEIKVSTGSEGLVAHPVLVSIRGGLALAWTEKITHGTWQINVRRFVNGALGPLLKLEESGLAWRPAMTVSQDGKLFVISEEKRDGAFAIYAREVLQDGFANSVQISAKGAGDCMRPAAASDKMGNVWISWDQADGINGPHVMLTRVSRSGVGDPIRISDHPASNIASAITVDDDGRVWIAWHSNRRGTNEWDIPRWYYLRTYRDGRLGEPVVEPLGKDLTKEGTDQSFEFPRVFAMPGGGVLVTGRPSHNFCLQYYRGKEFSPLYRLPIDTWGGRGQYLSAAFAPNGDLWVVRRDIGTNVLQKITGMPTNKVAPELKEVKLGAYTAPAIVNALRKPVWDPMQDLEGIKEPLNYYFGDIHGHTWMSDGMGDADEYYHIRRDYYGDDFSSLTDHDTFVRKSLMPSEYELIKEITQHFHKDGEFVTLFGQEYTTARYPVGLGHKCIYSTNMDIPLFDHTDKDADTSKKLNALTRQWKGLIIPHHIGWTGTDWENVEEDVQRIVEIVSNHGRFEFMGNEPIPHRGGLRGHFVQDGLARGLKFGLIGGSDNHGLIWHHGEAYKRDSYRTGLAVILAPELTREAIFDALMKRRCFATTGIKPRMEFRINNHMMGEEITSSDGKLEIKVDVASPVKIKWLTIVKNNEDWYHWGGEGWRSFFATHDNELEPGTSYYYLRAEFKSGDMAWSSPIWVTR